MPLDLTPQSPPYYQIDTGGLPEGKYWDTYYIARIAQAGTNAPTAIEASTNTLTPVTYTRTAVGEYKLSKTTSFPTNKTWILIWPNLGSTIFTINVYWLTTTDIKIESYASGVLTDGLITDTTIQIFTTP